MPIYVYECKKCAKVFEHEQRMVESALAECLCGENGPVKRLIQPSAIMFKGSGFHINDYAPKRSGDSSSVEDASGTKPESPVADSKVAAEPGNSDSKAEQTPPSAPASESKPASPSES